MLTFNNIYSESQEQTEDTSTSTLTVLKRAINQGAKKFGAILNREWRNTQKTFNIVASQQYYQTPEDCIRVKSVVVTVGDTRYDLVEIPDEITWNAINESTDDESDIPEFFYIRGSDEFGIYPTPSSSITSGGRLNYERRMRDMSAADYTTGTITVTNGSADVVGLATVFTAAMVGRSLKITDPDGDGMWYKIESYTSGTEITLENTYAGITAGGQAYTIGELPDIPEEFHESLIDYACWRYYRRRKDWQAAREMKAAYDEALDECKAQYSSKTTSQYIRPVKMSGAGYTYQNRNYKIV
jgi:hypothetical protein